MALTNIPEDESAWDDKEDYEGVDHEIDWAAHVAPDEEEEDEEDPWN